MSEVTAITAVPSGPSDPPPVRITGSALPAVGRRAGVDALGLMTEPEFQARLANLKAGQARLQIIHKELMERDVDYGIIPGTNKPTLLKPGAEKILRFYGLVPTFEERIVLCEDGTAPPIEITVCCSLHIGDADGPVVGSASGECNSWERKYRYRFAELSCPTCGKAGSIRRSRFEDRDSGDKGYYCWDKAGGCGATFRSTDPAIANQERGQIDNPDPFDLFNTVLKMAAKRALLAATLIATATSGLYTQDLEDRAPADAEPEPPTAPAASRQSKSPSARQDSPPSAWSARTAPESAGDRAANAPRAESRPEAPQNAGTEKPLVCENPECGKALTKGQRDVSVRAFGGQAYCPACQRLAKDGVTFGQPAPAPASEPAPEAPAAEPVASQDDKKAVRQWVDFAVHERLISETEAKSLIAVLIVPAIGQAKVLQIGTTLQARWEEESARREAAAGSASPGPDSPAAGAMAAGMFGT